MESTAMSPAPEVMSQLARLEKENHNLIKRVEKLEKQHRFSLTGLLANVLLLVLAGLFAGYLGFFPPGVERLPLKARSVEAEGFILLNPDGSIRSAITADDRGLHTADDGAKPAGPRPASNSPKPLASTKKG
jgi:hypothetical protein